MPTELLRERVGSYVGEQDGARRGWNTMVYDEHEVARIARVAFEQAR